MNLTDSEVRGVTHVIGGFYDAAADAMPWRDALHRLNGLFDIQGTIFEHHDVENRSLLEFEATNLPSEALDQWVQHYHSICPRLDFLQHQPAGTIGFDARVLEPTEIKKHPLYQDFLRPYGCGYFLSTTLEHDQERYTTLAMQRTLRQGHVSDRDIELLKLITKPMQHAFRLKKRLRLAREKLNDYEAAFHELTVGVIIVDENGRLEFINGCADVIASTSTQLNIRNGHLSFSDPSAKKMFAKALSGVTLDPGVDLHGYHCGIPMDGKRLPLRVDILSLPKQVQLTRSLLRHNEPSGRLLVILSDPTRQAEPPKRLLRTFFGLTEKEANVAVALSRGASLKEFADEQGIGLSTVRTHLVHLREKLGARNQADVVRIVSQLRQPLAG